MELRMVRADLEAAGLSYRDERGRVFDFHALRHQFLSSLAAAGVHPKVAQSLARHSTITLTMDRYAHLGLYDQSAALDQLPGLPLTNPDPIAAQATGTDGSPAWNDGRENLGPNLGPKTAISGDQVRLAETENTKVKSNSVGAKSFRNQGCRGIQGRTGKRPLIDAWPKLPEHVQRAILTLANGYG
jgi:hypothetical protein